MESGTSGGATSVSVSYVTAMGAQIIYHGSNEPATANVRSSYAGMRTFWQKGKTFHSQKS